MQKLVIAGLVSATSAFGCFGGSPASPLAKAPEYAPQGAAKCSVLASQSQPLIVEWPSTERAKLEATARNGPVVVRYSGCEMQILDRCRAKGSYGYVATTRKRDTVAIRNSDELYANIPMGAARLEGALERAGELDVSLTLVGRYEAAGNVYKPEELDGACAGATHVITGMSVGAFKFFTAGKGSVRGGVGVAGAGVGAGTSSRSDILTEDGAENDCERASRADTRPPGECSALLRIEVVKLGEMKTHEAVCPAGTKWDGNACIATKVVTQVSCPEQTTWDGRGCIAADGTRATEIAEVRTPDSVLVDFVPPSGPVKWSVIDSDGGVHCTLPCTRWVKPNNGLALKAEPSSIPKSGTVETIPPAALPLSLGAPGAHLTATPRRRIWGGPVLPIVIGVGLTAGAVGIGMIANGSFATYQDACVTATAGRCHNDNHPGDLIHPAASNASLGLTTGGFVIFGIGLIALIIELNHPSSSVVDVKPVASTSPGASRPILSFGRMLQSMSWSF